MRTHTLLSCLILLCAVAAAQIPSSAPERNTRPNSIDTVGEIVGVYEDASGHTRGFLYTGKDYQKVDYPGATMTEVLNINDRGDLAGDYTDANNTVHGFVREQGEFRTFDVPNAVKTVVRGVTATRTTAGYFDDKSGQRHGFIFKDERFTNIDYPSAAWTEVDAVNYIGDLVGWYLDSKKTAHGFRYTAKKKEFTAADVPGATATRPQGLSPTGWVVGTFEALGSTHGFQFVDDKFTNVDFPNAMKTEVRGLNPVGDLVGSYVSMTDQTVHGFKFHDSVFAKLDVDFTPAPAPKGHNYLIGIGIALAALLLIGAIYRLYRSDTSPPPASRASA